MLESVILPSVHGEGGVVDAWSVRRGRWSALLMTEGFTPQGPGELELRLQPCESDENTLGEKRFDKQQGL
jgi:hypothetical protein